MKYLILLFLTLNVGATVFYDDDRLDFHQIPEKFQQTAEASIALIHKYKLKKIGNRYKLDYKNLEKAIGFCRDANFSQQPQGANCSGALIKGNAILTAAHCVSKSTKGYMKDDFYVVFNYKKRTENQREYWFDEKDIFTMTTEIHYDFDLSKKGSMLDLAIFKLNRPVHYKPAKLEFVKQEKGDRVFVLGYPLGIALKLSDDSKITTLAKASKNSFRHELDTFSVNSGSPIFNSEHKIIGVHVRGTGRNWNEFGRDCYDWGKGVPETDFGEANDLLSIKEIYKSLK